MYLLKTAWSTVCFGRWNDQPLPTNVPVFQKDPASSIYTL